MHQKVSLEMILLGLQATYCLLSVLTFPLLYVFPWCLSVSKFSFYKDSSMIGLGRTLLALFEFSHLFKSPISNTVTL